MPHGPGDEDQPGTGDSRRGQPPRPLPADQFVAGETLPVLALQTGPGQLQSVLPGNSGLGEVRPL